MPESESVAQSESNVILLAQASATMPPIAGDTTASIVAPDNALAQVKALLPEGQQATGMTVLLAVVGVAGGAGAVKLYRDFAKNKHEESMKRLEIEQQRTEKQDDQHKTCAVERAALETKIVALDAKLNELLAKLEEFRIKAERAAASNNMFEDFDPNSLGELEVRLARLERAAKSGGSSRRKS